ncbi:hypothetical protein AAFN85_03755 [Mucilaginibacter sp. CAU 1740]|uniref:hypothetical protein n=1 Tax=Mucilaginibacter sp. CAU 1740 TaxID=3140365 RepID=UPI00325B445C
MTGNIYSHTHLIGTTEILPGDISMSHVYDLFTPNEAFDTYVRPHFKKHWLTSRISLKNWDDLKLNVQLENDYFIYAGGGITLIEDEEGIIQADIAGVDTEVIRDFILTKPAKPFVEEPWETISIKQKIAFEEELHKELGTNRFFRQKHPLQGFKLEALCKHCGNDDVLFTIGHPGSKNTFAVIHLTWRGETEMDNYPSFKFFEDLDSFRELRMFPDKADWLE